MNIRFPRVAYALPIVLLAGACSTTTPSEPTSSTALTGISSGGINVAAFTASVTAPRPQQPANLSQIQFASQPVTLTVLNAVVTRPNGGTVYTFEVATDAN